MRFKLLIVQCLYNAGRENIVERAYLMEKWMLRMGSEMHRCKECLRIGTRWIVEQDGRAIGIPYHQSANYAWRKKEMCSFLKLPSLLLSLTMLSKRTPLYSPDPTGFQWLLILPPVEIRYTYWEHYLNSPRIWTDTSWNNMRNFWSWDGHSKACHLSGSPKSPSAPLSHFSAHIPCHLLI